MKCHYEVLGVSQKATDDELKKSYRKMALQWHPDKNPDCVEEAKLQFQLIQAAYETLSDPHERAFYDRNRESILRGKGSESDGRAHTINLFAYFRSQCYSGFNDSEKGFYTVYRRLFEEIAAEDMKYMDDEEEIFIPTFGSSDTDLEDVAQFYAYWSNYCTSMSFSWADQYDIREAQQMGRWVEKKIEKENNKARQKARKEFNEEVRALITFVRNRDKRWAARKKMMQAKAAENVQKQKESQRKQREERRKMMEETVEHERSKLGEYEDELKQLEEKFADEWGITDSEYSDSEEGSEGEEKREISIEENVNGDLADDDYASAELLDDLYCVACNKMFKTKKSMENHNRSKKHRENLEALKESLLAEDEMFGADDLLGGSLSADDEKQSDENVCTLPPTKSSKKKKKKKKNAIDKASELLQEENSVTDNVQSVLNGDQTHNGHEVSSRGVEVEEEEKGSQCQNGSQEERLETKPKLKGKKAKEARKLARQTQAEASAESDKKDLQCSVCGQEFPSKNKLFLHLKAEGHAILKSSSSQSGKKGSTRTKK